MMKTSYTLFLFALLCLGGLCRPALAQQFCGDIENEGDTLLRIRKGSILPGQTYQWYKNGAPIPGATAPFLRISGAAPQDVFTLKATTQTEEIEVTEPKVLIGKALSPNLQPIAGAQVRWGALTAQTDSLGGFTLSLPAYAPSRLVLRFTKPGYFNAIKAVYQTDGDTLYLAQTLIPLGAPFELDTRFAGTLFNPLTFVTLPAHSLQDENGGVYAGPYKGYLCSFAPSNPQIADLMPGGDFMALTAQNDTAYLQTYGFLGVELRDTAGRPLQLRPGFPARVVQKIEAGMLSGAPAQMPLWHFDEARGLWVEEGAPALKSADGWYQGQVTHFSSWNFDIPVPRCPIKGKVLDCVNLPIRGAAIEIYCPSLNQKRGAFTDSRGNFGGLVPANTPIKVIYQTKDTVALAPLPENQVFELPVFIGDYSAALGVGGVARCEKDSTVLDFIAPEGVAVTFLNPNRTVTQSSPVFAGDYRNAQAFWAVIQNPVNECQPLDTLKVPTYSAPVFEGACNNLPVNNITHNTLERSFQALPFSIHHEHQAVNTPHLRALLESFPCLKAVNAGTINLAGLPAAIGRHSQLQRLFLNDNQLTSLPESIGNLTQLQWLRLYNNQLTSLPESIGNLTQLQTLDLNSNQLTSLPESIGNLTQLQHLDLTFNQLTSLPQSIGNLTQLQWIMLFNNQLTSLPESIGNLIQLRDLRLESNRLTSLPESIGNLTQLRTLLLGYNRLTSLPESIGNLTQLNWLRPSGNQLTSLPESIGNLNQLHGLGLSDNQLTSLPQSIGNLNQLHYLGLSDNQLTSLPESFGNLTQLQTLTLNNNQLTSLPQSIGNLIQLLELHVHDNQLTSLPESIGNLTQLRELSLFNNQLTSLPESIANLAGNLQSLDLRGNPIPVEQRAQIQQWLPNTQITW